MTDSERLQNLLGKLEQRFESGDDKFDDIDSKLLDIQNTMVTQGQTLAVLKDRSDGSVRAAQKSGDGGCSVYSRGRSVTPSGILSRGISRIKSPTILN